MLRYFLKSICFLCLFVWLVGSAYAQEKQCGQFNQVVKSKKGPEISIPETLLGDANVAAKCLGGSLRKLAAEGPSLDFSWDLRTRLNRTAGALVRLIRKNGSSQNIIQKVREQDNLDVINLLAYGARSKDRPTRLNSTQLLANIVDNTSVCVVMDHFADPAFDKVGSGEHGRANLISVVAVVAPWAYQENYRNISNLYKYLTDDIRGKRDQAQTKKKLRNLKARLDYQDRLGNRANKENRLPRGLNDCLNFKPDWAKGRAEFQLSY